MALIKSYKGLSPKWGKDCYFSENATIVGDVTLGDQCSVWFNAVVRGDVAPITMANGRMGWRGDDKPYSKEVRRRCSSG